MTNEIRFEVDCEAEVTDFHSEMEILYVLSGRTAVMVNGTNFVLQSEDFIVFNPWEHHALYRENGSHTLSLYILSSYISDNRIGQLRCCSHIDKEHQEYLGLIRSKLALLFKAYNAPDENRMYILSQLFGLLAILKQEFESNNETEINFSREKDNIRKAFQYIETHYKEKLSLQEVADHVYLSRSYLSKEFQKSAGVSFADHLRTLRLNEAMKLLRNSEKSINEIALESGFSNINTFISNFHEVYGCTPGVWRRQKLETASADTQDMNPGLSYMGLLRHAPYEEVHQPLNKKIRNTIRMHIELKRNLGEFHSCHRDVISIGWAESLLNENVRNTIRRAKKEIGFHYMYFHGLLDDSLEVYHENTEGNIWLSFTYVDMILDFLVSVGVLPWIELGFTPARLAEKDQRFGDSVILLPQNFSKWQNFIQKVIEHFTERYGEEEVKKWRFSPTAILYASYGVFSVDKYFEYYFATCKGIQQILPTAKIYGCTFDTGFLAIDGDDIIVRFLDFCRKNNCIPDGFTIQNMGCDYLQMPRSEIERRISARGELKLGEPAPVSQNKDILQKEILTIKQILDTNGMKNCPIYVTAWNSTLWQADLGNDTCHKSAYIFKSFLETSSIVNGLAYCHLTDNTERKIVNSNVFHGGGGLTTYRGLAKAAYFAYELLKYMDGIIIAQGEGYLLTRSKNGKKIQIGLYNYCHINPETHINHELTENEQCNIDRYYGFEDKGVMISHFYLRGMQEGTYSKTIYSINRDHGSSYDRWMEIGAPEILMESQLNYLEKSSLPNQNYEKIYIEKYSELLISAVLDTHEVRVICIEKR